ncbi:TPA: hypothetical protein J5F57_003536 [Escherichia coli]|uniref:hypothetical protein n=1 Tax=Hafnia paralvei TaxID=546367 RepID=UPI001B1B6867|nr:hypothetical protein [Hafnia paralvei]MBU2672603.1 hypothetical protein [Hafnia paralvei]HBA3651398.1 hypothetical protein [Escherichia coli]
MTTITKESLKAKIKRLESTGNAEYGLGRTLSEDYQLAAYRMLLAGMEQEPKSKAAVATLEGHGFTWCGGEQWKPPLGLPPVFISNDREELERYRKAAASVVPKVTDHDARMAVGFNRYAQSGYIEGWNACRAAMLQSFGNSEQVQAVTRIECDLSLVDTEKLTAAIREMNSKPSEPQRIITEPVSQPYKLPDDWVAVPKEPTEDMIIAGFESEPDEHFSEPGEWAKYDAMSGCQQAAHKARLCWAAMIKAAPKPGDK